MKLSITSGKRIFSYLFYNNMLFKGKGWSVCSLDKASLSSVEHMEYSSMEILATNHVWNLFLHLGFLTLTFP